MICFFKTVVQCVQMYNAYNAHGNYLNSVVLFPDLIYFLFPFCIIFFIVCHELYLLPTSWFKAVLGGGAFSF